MVKRKLLLRSFSTTPPPRVTFAREQVYKVSGSVKRVLRHIWRSHFRRLVVLHERVCMGVFSEVFRVVDAKSPFMFVVC